MSSLSGPRGLLLGLLLALLFLFVVSPKSAKSKVKPQPVKPKIRDVIGERMEAETVASDTPFSLELNLVSHKMNLVELRDFPRCKRLSDYIEAEVEKNGFVLFSSDSTASEIARPFRFFSFTRPVPRHYLRCGVVKDKAAISYWMQGHQPVVLNGKITVVLDVVSDECHLLAAETIRIDMNTREYHIKFVETKSGWSIKDAERI
eukprot:GHVS01105315.1.p1 GENE.GHVS01105315.1~~GHVS01105315.1.p1  ORF type:complete len:204 (+),score=15.95 GHVS01105315.1:333-944(+)